MRALILASLAVITLSACSGRALNPIRDFGVPTLTTAEKEVIIYKDLILPPSFNVLPQPTPGGTNRADP